MIDVLVLVLRIGVGISLRLPTRVKHVILQVKGAHKERLLEMEANAKGEWLKRF